jgi:hypothetical protein
VADGSRERLNLSLMKSKLFDKNSRRGSSKRRETRRLKDMSKAQGILLIGIVGFYLLLLAYLLLRVCAMAYRSLRPHLTHGMEKVFDAAARMRLRQARTRQVWHAQVVLDLTRVARQSAVASRHPKALC